MESGYTSRPANIFVVTPVPSENPISLSGGNSYVSAAARDKANPGIQYLTNVPSAYDQQQGRLRNYQRELYTGPGSVGLSATFSQVALNNGASVEQAQGWGNIGTIIESVGLGARFSSGRTQPTPWSRNAYEIAGPATAGRYQITGPAYNVSTAGMTAAERQAVVEYAKRSNVWLEANGGTTVQSTAGKLRSQSNSAGRNERLSAARAGTPYIGQAGHVPDTALTGLAQPPAGWLDMPGRSNSVVGGGLSSRIGQRVGVITVDGKTP